jgi:hypothetical protein
MEHVGQMSARDCDGKRYNDPEIDDPAQAVLHHTPLTPPPKDAFQ